MDAHSHLEMPIDGSKRLSRGILYVLSPNVVRRNLLIAAIVGCALSVANQYEVIARAQFTSSLGVKVFFNFLIPFIVSSISAAVNRTKR